jgi:hypothetical protein
MKYEHDNIIKYYDHFATNDFLFIVTEYCVLTRHLFETKFHNKKTKFKRMVILTNTYTKKITK